MDRQPCLSLEGQKLVHDVQVRIARYPASVIPVEERQTLATCAPASHAAAGRAVGDLVGQETLHRASVTVDREDEPPLPALEARKARHEALSSDEISCAQRVARQVRTWVQPRDPAACSNILSGL